ncbi:hypothetical protein [Dactylosporangium matsuzakiense]|uniref:Amidase n=1 Tax=Dactylosporangium matsuzakiense TaxID=53360 RepID=A0A9W6NIU8_9ACTN|nr:hypothetical protein [Dactylosporangium matsuzakiense]UWZ47223.1 hypothetical protein Dmats_12925 [Dactylosporangium matsuzakiense]GLK98330.1 hypothetical protein GCM10017581_000710 [Dactylosporangium matsuzakiense]
MRRALDSAAQAGLCVLLVGIALIAATPLRLPALGPETAVAPPGTRAMWLWEQDEPRPVVEWAAANGVRALFAYYDPQAGPAELRRLATLKGLCDDAGITLDALGGDPSWTTAHATALTWAASAAATGLFHGLHVDVEPYLLPSWPNDKAALVPPYLALLQEMSDATELPVEADVPFWLPTVTLAGGQNLADAVLARVAGVTVMSYRNTATGANSIVGVADDLLRRAGAAAKPARLGAETQALGDCSYCSFHGTSEERLHTTLSAVDAAAQRYPAFAGIAVHQYESWVALSS